MTLPTYIDILSFLLNDEEPIYALITTEIINHVSNNHNNDEKVTIRDCVIKHCKNMIVNDHVKLLWEYKVNTLNTKESIENMINMHTSSPIDIYTIAKSTSYFYNNFNGDYVLSITETGRKYLNKYEAE